MAIFPLAPEQTIAQMWSNRFNLKSTPVTTEPLTGASGNAPGEKCWSCNAEQRCAVFNPDMPDGTLWETPGIHWQWAYV